ncbi:MAG TPA: hypothetical protein VE596_07790 [Gaiellaceae bacterium]|nr:hypothetical protein [Gaiellaceae bacterium]
MDEARNVLARLDRIDELHARGAPPGALLAEVRVLLAEAEEWLEAEAWLEVEPAGARRAETAVARSRAALARRREVAMM